MRSLMGNGFADADENVRKYGRPAGNAFNVCFHPTREQDDMKRSILTLVFAGIVGYSLAGVTAQEKPKALTEVQQCLADLGAQEIAAAQAQQTVLALQTQVVAGQQTIQAFLQQAAGDATAKLATKLAPVEKSLVTALGGTWKDDGTGDRFDWTSKTLKKAAPPATPGK